jgi:pumilio homology domain family member 6
VPNSSLSSTKMAPMQTKTKKRPAKVQSGPPSKKILIADSSGHAASVEKLGRKRSRPVTAPLVEEDEEDEEKEDDEGDMDELVESIDDISDEMDMEGTKAPKDPTGTSGSPVISN